ncbi:MAG: protein-glutamate O-methyltransferase CheR, partial [Pseudomonadota bacterium]
MSDADFRFITAIAAKEAGLAIPDTKRSLVQSRIVRRMRNLGLTSCRQYLEHLEGNFDETQNLISALTTNVSHFFRELHHFEYLRNELLDQSAKQLRFWSAGCSNGQEPYSLAIEILKKIPDAASRDILILATDIDETVLANAAEGRYTESDIKGVPEEERTKFFQKVAGDTFEVDEALKRLVRFKK